MVVLEHSKATVGDFEFCVPCKLVLDISEINRATVVDIVREMRCRLIVP
jgi:hypothetical protein